MMTRSGLDLVAPTAAQRQTIAIVGKRPDPHVLNTVLKASDYDILLIESVGNAYSQIKRMRPQIVIVCLEAGDLEGVQVLSMLNIDDATANIPVVTYFASPDADRGNPDADTDADTDADADADADGSEDQSDRIDSSLVHHMLLRSMN
jgi:hypothetical protein